MYNFERLVRDELLAERKEELNQVSLVALVLDSTASQLNDRASGSSTFAVVKHGWCDAEQQHETKVLYTIVAPSKHIAFYIMCIDACKYKSSEGEGGDKEDDVACLDPEYRTLDVVTLLKDVGDRASWKVGDLWKSFVASCDSGEIYPYEIVDATSDHIAGFRQYFK